ncbi:protein enabled homolog isoform X5 [Anguilla rostrata]|uniref:protein enabled homolog isoform X5 n=1 Tax=Anguilla rostrata TaxID=7938 RepID=UPI0030CE3DDF
MENLLSPKEPAPLKKLKRKRRKVKNTTRHHRATPEESSTEESTGDRDTEEVTPGRQVPQNASGVGQTRQRRFKSTVTPLPRLQPQRLTGHRVSGEEEEEEEEQRPRGRERDSRGLHRKEKAQPSVRWAPGAVVDSDQQRKTEAERQRNKKRLREKQRQAQRDSSPGHRHGHAGQGNQEGRRAKRRSRAGASQAESDLAAWRRVQAQISSLLDPELGDFNGHSRTMQGALAFPRSPAHFQGYSYPMPLEFVPPGPMMGRGYPFPSAGPPQPTSSQLVNSFGAWAQPWQKAPIPNTRHNAEFLRSLQPPSHPPPYPPSFHPPAPPPPPPHPSFYPQPSGLADSLLDGGGTSSAGGQSRSPEPPSPSASARRPGNPPLSPGSQNYLRQLSALIAAGPPRAGGKRKAKRSAFARDDGGRPRPQPPDGEEGSESA